MSRHHRFAVSSVLAAALILGGSTSLAQANQVNQVNALQDSSTSGPTAVSAAGPEFTLDDVDTTSPQARTALAANALYGYLWKENQDTLGGVWADESDPSLLHVTVTSSLVAGLIPTIASQLKIDPSVNLAIGVVVRPAILLRGTSYSIGEQSAALRAEGIKVWAWMDDFRNDRVIVNIEPSSVPDAAAQIRKMFGDFVEVGIRENTAAAEADRFTDYPSLRGGQAIQRGGTRCSAGIGVQSTHNGGYYVITAGHCDGSGSTASWVMGYNSGQNQTVGQSGTNLLPAGSGLAGNCDCLAIGPLTSRQANNVVYTSPTTGVNLAGACGQYCLGASANICMSGASTATNGIHCGSLYAYSSGCVYGNTGTTVNGQGLSTYSNAGGDSGGAVYSGTSAVGINSGYCPIGGRNYSTISWIDLIEQRIAVATLTFDPA